MRIKTRWHNKGDKPPEENAGVAAFITWRLAERCLLNLQKEDYDIKAGDQPWIMIAELLAFSVHLFDRLVYPKLSDEDRGRFVSELASRLGDILGQNIERITGERNGGYRRQFIDLVNRRSPDYATFNLENGEPDFGFRRYLGLRFQELTSSRDRTWVVDQIMDIEIPSLVKITHKTVDDLYPPDQTE